MINSVFKLTFNIIYVNQFIIELYSTILETNAIRNVQTFMTSYLDIKVYELYNTFNGTDILVYVVINIVKLMASSRDRNHHLCGNHAAVLCLHPYLKGRQHHHGDRGDIIAENHHHEDRGDSRAHPCEHPQQ